MSTYCRFCATKWLIYELFHIKLHIKMAYYWSAHMLKDAHANCFCASLLCTKFTHHIMHRACIHVLSSKVNNNRENSNHWLCMDLTILDVLWPLFFFWRVVFSADFLCMRKNEKIYWVEFWIFCKCSIEFRLFDFFV